MKLNINVFTHKIIIHVNVVYLKPYLLSWRYSNPHRREEQNLEAVAMSTTVLFKYFVKLQMYKCIKKTPVT